MSIFDNAKTTTTIVDFCDLPAEIKFKIIKENRLMSDDEFSTKFGFGALSFRFGIECLLECKELGANIEDFQFNHLGITEEQFEEYYQEIIPKRSRVESKYRASLINEALDLQMEMGSMITAGIQSCSNEQLQMLISQFKTMIAIYNSIKSEN